MSRGTRLAWREYKKRSLELLQLESEWLWRKYFGIANVAVDVLRNAVMAVPIPYETYWIGQEAMQKHAS